MGNQYQPDRWIIVEIKQEGKEPWRRILSGWYGGYLGSDSWRLSSGITEVIEHDKYYEIHNESGSLYTCYKSAHGVSGLMGGVLHNWQEQAKDRDDVDIAEVDVSELLKET